MNPLAAAQTPSSSQTTALKGASLAFNKKPPVPAPTKKDNGALTAATSANRPRSPVRQHDTGESEAGIGSLAAMKLSPPAQLHPAAQRVDQKSPSFIAATLAASRSASPTPKRRGSVEGVAVDSGSIAPTGSLISMFEQGRKGQTGDPVKKASPKRSPVRMPALSTEEMLEERLGVPVRQMTVVKPQLKPKPRPVSPPPPPQIISRSTPEVLSPRPTRLTKPRLPPVTPPPDINRQEPTPSSPVPVKRSPKAKQRPPTPPKPRGSQKATAVNEKAPILKPQKSKPDIAPPKTPTRWPQTPKSASVSSEDTFVSASSAPSPTRSPSPPSLSVNRQPALILSPSPPRTTTPAHTIRKPDSPAPPAVMAPVPPPARRTRPGTSSTTNLPLDSLTNAIMAGSLASARLTPHNTGNNLPAPPLPKRQKSPRLMQTLRQPAKLSDEESDRHKKGHLSKLHSGKHAHHEGSRKKWRDEITPRERKRYEAVWASNRGVLLDQHDASLIARNGEIPEYVVNVVVREIWKRSRLPPDELAEVWDLVDRKGRGVLGRQEFVVGMWLIDQRLRGRKIPAKVTDSVWGSANGMRVMKPRIK